MKKRGAIELSIGAIIILIIGIVVLALTLAFIRGMFTTVVSSTESEIGKEPDPWPASGGEPITISREKILTYPGENEVLKVQFYNDGAEADLVPDLECNDNEVIKDVRVMSQIVASGSTANYNYLFTVGNVAVKNYICRVSFIDATAGINKRKDIEVQVLQ